MQLIVPGFSLHGRPYGGCSFLIRNSILNMVTRIDSRFCAISINSDSLVTLLVCVYLPTNYGTHDSDDLFQQTLSEISGFLDSCCYDSVIIAGDFIVDFKRNSSFSEPPTIVHVRSESHCGGHIICSAD